MVPVVLAGSARRDLAEAMEWYGAESSELGERFHEEFTRVEALVSENPRAWPVIESGTRRIVFRHFPYSMIYSLHRDHVWVVAIVHHSRDPEHWRRRR